MKISKLLEKPVWIVGIVTACFMPLLVALAASGPDSRVLDLTKDFPWEFLVEEMGSERHDLLPGAVHMDNATLRTVQTVNAGASAESYVRIQYKNAMYDNRDVANQDYEKLIAKTDRPDRQVWSIVLQARRDLHWLQSECAATGAIQQGYFRKAYANLIDYVEIEGVVANRALLCDCEGECKKVAIDR
ncbi:MAG: hypothetical protein QNI91_05150 [Arenicellales bacterium]|nr:hypothetical protein [Arenicellales bacterium]